MPLKLVSPQEGRTPYYRVRGTHLGIYLDRSTKTREREVAARFLRKWRSDIECGLITRSAGTTFAEAAVAYMQFGGERRFLEPLLCHFGDTPIDRIDQKAVDEAADAILPRGKPATRDRQIYTPVSAVLNHVSADGRLVRFRRPKKPPGRTLWCEPEQAEKLFSEMSPKLARLGRFLLYTGCRISEATNLDWSTINLVHRTAYLPRTKNEQPRAVHLTDQLLAELAALPHRQGRVFGYRGRGSVAKRWREAAIRAGLEWITPHVMRHTWATWMRRYAGADLKDLVATGAWKSMQSALRYMHVIPGEAARAADKLPLPGAKSVRQK